MRSLLLQESPNIVVIITLLFMILAEYIGLKVLWYYFVIMFLLYMFYRNPERSIERSQDHVYSPSDGKIIRVDETDTYYLISAFLGLTDVHIQYVPYDGIIKNIKYIPGGFKLAFLDKADNNEKMVTTMKTSIGSIHITQIAGMLVRKIVNFNSIGDIVETGDKLGMIKFGSRVDIQLPKDKVKLLVNKGDKLIGGVTKIAQVIR